LRYNYRRNKAMKIRKLQLKNIGVFDDETIKFQPCPAKDKAEIHIFTGQNGTGKSTILQALASIFNPYLTATKISFIKDVQVRNINNFSKKFRSFFDKDSILAHSFLSISYEDNLINAVNPKTIVYPNTQTKELTVHDEAGSLSSYRHYLSGYSGEITFAAFAFSGYRQIESETVQANYLPKDFNPLSQSLDFIKDYRKQSEITINQLVANNISNRALSKEDKSFDEAEKYDAVINAIEVFIKDVTDYDVKFVLKRSPTELKLKIHGEELDFDVLPDGLRSLISWIADLLGRIDLLKWQDNLPITEKNLILLLDEIEVHLHPAWQRKVLPVVQKLFKNSQIFVSTHSPFVVNSVDAAWVYELKVENGKARVAEKSLTKTAYSYQTVLREVFDIDERFGEKTQEKLEDFLKQSRHIHQSNGNNEINKDEFLSSARYLASQSAELQSLVFLELARLSKETGEPYEI